MHIKLNALQAYSNSQLFEQKEYRVPINVIATPTKISWSNFSVVPQKIPDPNDGTLVDAVTAFNFDVPGLPPRSVDGGFMMADPNTIRITPNARVFNGVAQTAELLLHEQFHYDVGVATARSLARHMMKLKAATKHELMGAFQTIAKLHLYTRARLIQKRYDVETEHGTKWHFQKIWIARMKSVLANPRSVKIGGYWL